MNQIFYTMNLYPKKKLNIHTHTHTHALHHNTHLETARGQKKKH